MSTENRAAGMTAAEVEAEKAELHVLADQIFKGEKPTYEFRPGKEMYGLPTEFFNPATDEETDELYAQWLATKAAAEENQIGE